MQINRRIALFAALLLLFIVQGCTTLPVDKTPSDRLPAEIRQDVDLLLENESYEAAASLLQTLADQYPSPVRDQLLLEAAEAWLQANRLDAAVPLVDRISPPAEDAAFAFRLRMLNTQIAILRGDIDLALDLMQPEPDEDTPLALRQRYHQNMAEIFRLSGNLLESGRELNVLDGLQIDDEEARLKTQELLVQTLTSMTDTALQLLQPPPPSQMAGWMELARVVKLQIDQPAELASALADWRERFPEHPALQAYLASLLERQGLSSSDHIAILLPRSGPYAKVAMALQDGFMAAWYQQLPEHRPQLRFYDSSDPQQTLRIYQQAVLQGAQRIVGPLNKDAVSMLMQLESLPQPVLALNQVEEESPAPFFQFGLAPEDEAQQVAERAWLEGHQQALVLTPSGNWGDRIAEHFRQRFEALGGQVLEIQRYNAQENDYSAPIRLLLNIDESHARTQRLKQRLGMAFESEPRRRQDADFIFLAARPKQGRQLGPQLKFHHAGDLPIYATSHIYSGVAENERDRDLGHISFVDTPWLLEQEQQGELSRERLQRLMPGVKGQYARLYAMGIDSYNLLANLESLQQPGRTFSGKSGTLYLDRHNRLHRLLAWADMTQGSASIIGYAPRMHSPAMEPAMESGADPLAPPRDQPAQASPPTEAVAAPDPTPGTR